MNRRDFLLKSGAAASLGLFAKAPLFAQAPATNSGPAAATTTLLVAPPPPVTTFTPLRRNVGYFTGRGGSIGWLVNPDAVVAVDTQFPETAAIFLRDLPGRAGRTLDAVINTHHHGDHTGGNGVFRPATKTIVAHANVPGLMRAAAARNPKPPSEAELALMIPDLGFAEGYRQGFGDEAISCKYLGPAHTKGDIVVLFEQANVVHLGDLLFNRLYPVIDRPGGASIRHWVTVLEKIVADYPKDAIYVSGHGQAKFGVECRPADLLVFRDYLSALLAHVEGEIKAGKPKEEITKLENLAGFPDFHVPPGPGNRLPANLGVAYDELTAG
ncbi:MAG: MBL fold metallo-hydrolase [Opitutae bacterium]|nr:MBL fold metallo-hydrolase [Opitutae bacterium]